MRWSHVSPRAASPTNRQLPLSLLPPLLLKSPSFRNPRAGADAATRRLTTRRPENRRAIPRPRHSSSASRRSLEGCAASARPEARPPGAGLRIAAASQTCNDFYRGTRSLNRDHGPLAWPCDFSGAPPCRNVSRMLGAIALTGGASGTVRGQTTMLMTVEEVGSVTRKTIAYRPPGG